MCEWVILVLVWYFTLCFCKWYRQEPFNHYLYIKHDIYKKIFFLILPYIKVCALRRASARSSSVGVGVGRWGAPLQTIIIYSAGGTTEAIFLPRRVYRIRIYVALELWQLWGTKGASTTSILVLYKCI